MNELNYASLEASKRLIDAGIVLEADYVRIYARHIPLTGADGTWKLFDRHSLMAIEVTEQRPSALFPAPSMAEVWRELRKHIKEIQTYMRIGVDEDEDFVEIAYSNSLTHRNTNLTDALIDLLIWMRKENDHE